nr:reverse transcriptase domain-containing protein [Tanacetum cinerariifolium]
MRVLQVNQQVKAVTPNCKTCGGHHSFSDCPATVGNTQNVYAAGSYQAYQAPVYQAPVHQPYIPQPQVVTTNEFTNFMKANDAILKNMQTNMTSLTNSNLELKDMFGQFIKMNTASSSGLGTLSGNTITNPKEDIKGITTRRGTTYPGPTIPTTSSFSPVVECETEATKDTMHPINKGSTKDVQPSVVPTKSLILTSEPVNSPINEPVASSVSASKPNLRPSIPYPSRLLDQKLQLADRLISHPVTVAEDVFIKLGTFHFPNDFVVIDFDADPRVPLIIRRSFLKIGRALIDVFKGELTLRVGKEAITSNLDQTSRYSANYNDMTAKLIDSYLDSEGDIQLLEAFLNDDPSLPHSNQGNYLPEVRKELKICKAKSEKYSIDEPPEVELKDLPPHLEYVFLEGDDKLPVIIAKALSVEEKTALITVLKSHKRAIAWKLFDIKGIDLEFCSHKILMEEDFKPANELILIRLVMGWRVCINYRKLNEATRKDHFPLPFMDQILERLAGNQYYCFLDGFSGYFQIPIDPKDQEKTAFTCPYGTFAYRRMPFGLCNTPGTFQRCMMAIFHDMIENTMEVFMDDFLVFGNSFQSCLSHLEKMLKRCETPTFV